MRKLNWNQLSRYRGELCGIAIISILIFHYYDWGKEASVILKTLRRFYLWQISSNGVDLFLLLSGFGIAYSLTRTPDIVSFYKKRFERVLFPYLVMGTIHWIFEDFLISSKGIRRFLYHWTMLSFWGKGTRTFWYIALILVLYLVSPFVFRKKKKGIAAAWIISIALTFILYRVSPDKFKEIEIAVQRIPVYFMGMYLGMLAMEKKDIHAGWICAALLSLPVRYFLRHYKSPFSRLIDSLYVLLFCLIYVLIRDRLLSKVKDVRLFSVAGKYSLELYILHVSYRGLLKCVGADLLGPKKYGVFIIAVILSTAAFANLRMPHFRRKELPQ